MIGDLFGPHVKLDWNVASALTAMFIMHMQDMEENKDALEDLINPLKVIGKSKGFENQDFSLMGNDLKAKYHRINADQIPIGVDDSYLQSVLELHRTTHEIHRRLDNICEDLQQLKSSQLQRDTLSPRKVNIGSSFSNIQMQKKLGEQLTEVTTLLKNICESTSERAVEFPTNVHNMQQNSPPSPTLSQPILSQSSSTSTSTSSPSASQTPSTSPSSPEEGVGHRPYILPEHPFTQTPKEIQGSCISAILLSMMQHGVVTREEITNYVFTGPAHKVDSRRVRSNIITVMSEIDVDFVQDLVSRRREDDKSFKEKALEYAIKYEEDILKK
jgi:hypothetical protein